MHTVKHFLLLPLLAALLSPITGLCNNGEIFMKEAAAKEQQGDLAGALEDYKSAYGNFGSNLRYNDGDPGVDYAARMAAADDKIASLSRAYAPELEKKGDYEHAAWQFYEEMERKRDDVQSYYDCARMYYRAGDLIHALRYSTRAIEMKPDYAEACALRGSVKLCDARLYDALHSGRAGGMMVSLDLIMTRDFVDVKITDVNLAGALADLDKALKLKPAFPDACDCRGLVKYYKGDMAGAIADFTKAIALKPGFAFAYDNRAHAKLAAGDAKGALADFDKAAALKPDFAAAFAGRAAAKLSGGDMPGALADIDKAVALKADYIPAYDFRGLLRLAKGDEAGAKGDFGKAVELRERNFISQGNWDIYFNDPTFVKQVTGDLDGALAGIEDAPLVSVKDAKLAAAFAGAYLRRASRAGGTVVIGPATLADLDRAIALKPDFEEAFRERGIARDFAVEYGGERYEQDEFSGGDEVNPLLLVTPEPAPAGAQGKQGAAKPARDSEMDGALADLDKALALKPDDEKALKGRAHVKQAKGDLAGALADFDRAAALAPEDADAYGARGIVKKALGDLKGARIDDIHGADLTVQQAKTPQDSSWAYFCRAGEKQKWNDIAGAVEDFTRSIAATTPGYPPAYFARASIEYGRGDAKAAMDDLNTAIAIAPLDADSHYLRGVIERDKGDMDAALEDFKKTSAQRHDHDALRETALIEHARKDDKAAGEKFDEAIRDQFSSALMCADHHDSVFEKAEMQCLDGIQGDLDKAAGFQGTNLESVLNRVGCGYMWQGRERQGDKFDQLIALRPGMGALYFIRGGLNFEGHSLPAALSDFQKALSLANVPGPSLDEARLFIWVIRAQSGGEKAATEDLHAWLDSRKPDAPDGWYAQIAGFLTGHVAEADFLNSAANGDSNAGGEGDRKSEVYFYAGAKRLAAGDKSAAADYFNKSAQARGDGTIEQGAARAELRLLNPAP